MSDPQNLSLQDLLDQLVSRNAHCHSAALIPREGAQELTATPLFAGDLGDRLDEGTMAPINSSFFVGEGVRRIALYGQDLETELLDDDHYVCHLAGDAVGVYCECTQRYILLV